MNKDHEQQKLDQLIQQWSAAHEPTASHIDAMASDVSNAIEQNAIGGSLAIETKTGWRSAAAATVVLAIAASLIAMIAWQSHERDEDDQDVRFARQEVSPQQPIIAFSQQRCLEMQRMLGELDRIFEGKQVWFAETDQDVVLGNPPAIKSHVQPGQAIAMRLVLAKRGERTEHWQPVWAADVVSRSDQVAEFLLQKPGESASSASCLVWTHALPDGQVAYDVNLDWKNGRTLAIKDSVIAGSGEKQFTPIQLGADEEYRLFHCASVLNAKAG